MEPRDVTEDEFYDWYETEHLPGSQLSQRSVGSPHKVA
jgi:hypothetical protein